jgi:DNA-binding CsgD family transcriptional regulator
MVSALSRAGSRGRRIAAALRGPAALTQRERLVATLAARGHSAEQCGKRLFIGTRTVETHLAHIYPKLGVGSKQELIAKAHELGIAEPRP